MEAALGKGLRDDLLKELNTLRVACEALGFPMEPAAQAIYLDDMRSACDAVTDHLDEMYGPLPVHPDRVAPFQWIMDPESYPQA